MRDYSTYHNTGFKDRVIHYGKQRFDRSLTESPESYEVLVNGEEKNIIVYTSPKYGDSQVKRSILFNRGEVLRGDMVFHDGKDWIVFDMPFYNRIYEQSTMLMCTDTMNFTYLTDGVIEDYDLVGNPIYSEEPQEVTKQFKCSVDSVRDLDLETSKKINLPEGYVMLYIQSTDDELISLGKEFEIFGEYFRIRGIDKSMLFNDYGVLEIIAEKTTKNN